MFCFLKPSCCPLQFRKNKKSKGLSFTLGIMSEATSVRAQEVKRRHLELLQEENAFVDESEALRRKRSRSDKGGASSANDNAGGNGDNDEDDSFLGTLRASARWHGDATLRRRSSTAGGRGGGGGRGGSQSGEFPKRLHLAKVLQDQHQTYMTTLLQRQTEDDEDEENAAVVDKDVNVELERRRKSSSVAATQQQQQQPTSTGSSGDDTSSLWIGSGIPTLPTDEHILTAFVAQRRMLEAWLAAENAPLDDASRESTLESMVGPTPSFLSTFFTPDDIRSQRSSAAAVTGSSRSKHAPPRVVASRQAKAPGGNMICAVCLKPGAQYVCVRCGVTRYCSPDCHEVHDEMRCLKHVM